VVYLLDPRGYSSSNYLFDRVFGPETGAGKSHTMKGSLESPGLIPRATSKLFEEIHGARAEDICYDSLLKQCHRWLENSCQGFGIRILQERSLRYSCS
jgi:hypothetical protein